ncbi:MAG: hypothetical protein RsTaC01_0917 [Candidatus Paraimprobicoccus trichonymphae]|uniref:Uncharacterized protein n=1 Tax=Candidatus Paraimprobicoccus trichonymphae TaxID=3033793 RepID=A0AA48I6H9_9FIRM|nr:MAG: hypothetical protein RsTaC01_0917 [Candidatus Paraimprobicoccus trichonymphae]
MNLEKLKENSVFIIGGCAVLVSLLLSAIAIHKSSKKIPEKENTVETFNYDDLFESESWIYEMAKISINSDGSCKFDGGYYFEVTCETDECNGLSPDKLVHGQKNDKFVMFGLPQNKDDTGKYKALLKRNDLYYKCEVKVTLHSFNDFKAEFMYELVLKKLGIKSETNIFKYAE